MCAQLEATHLLEQQQQQQQGERPTPPRRTTSEPVTIVPPPVRTDGMSREELSESLRSFYDMLASTVTSNQDDLGRLRAELADKDSRCEPHTFVHHSRELTSELYDQACTHCRACCAFACRLICTQIRQLRHLQRPCTHALSLRHL